MEQPMDNALVRLQATFEGHHIDIIWLRDRPHWVCRQVGSALGYATGARMAEMAAAEWSDDLLDGVDRILLTGDELRALKELRPDLLDKRTPSLLLLTESGLYTALMLSRQPKARAFRRWLADDVLPQLRTTGAYALPGASPAAALDGRVDAVLDLLLHLPHAVAVQQLAQLVRTAQHRAAEIAGHLADLVSPANLPALPGPVAHDLDVSDKVRHLNELLDSGSLGADAWAERILHVAHTGLPDDLVHDVAALALRRVGPSAARARVTHREFQAWAAAALHTVSGPGMSVRQEPAFASFAAWYGYLNLGKETRPDFFAWMTGQGHRYFHAVPDTTVPRHVALRDLTVPA